MFQRGETFRIADKLSAEVHIKTGMLWKSSQYGNNKHVDSISAPCAAPLSICSV